LWRCGDSLFFEVFPLASDALLTTLHPLLENVLQTVDNFEISCLGAPFFMVGKAKKLHGARSEMNSVFGLEKVYRWNPTRTSSIQSSPQTFQTALVNSNSVILVCQTEMFISKMDLIIAFKCQSLVKVMHKQNCKNLTLQRISI
jgi:hypothetical protein